MFSSQEDDGIEDFTQDPFFNPHIASPNYHSDLDDSPVIVVDPAYGFLSRVSELKESGSSFKRIAESPPDSQNFKEEDCIMVDLTTSRKLKRTVLQKHASIDLSNETPFSNPTKSVPLGRSPALYSEHFTNKTSLNSSNELSKPSKHGLSTEPQYLSRFPTKKRDSPVRSLSFPNFNEATSPLRQDSSNPGFSFNQLRTPDPTEPLSFTNVSICFKSPY